MYISNNTAQYKKIFMISFINLKKKLNKDKSLIQEEMQSLLCRMLESIQASPVLKFRTKTIFKFLELP